MIMRGEPRYNKEQWVGFNQKFKNCELVSKRCYLTPQSIKFKRLHLSLCFMLLNSTDCIQFLTK